VALLVLVVVFNSKQFNLKGENIMADEIYKAANGMDCAWLALSAGWHGKGHVEIDKTKLRNWKDIYDLIQGFTVSVRQLQWNGNDVPVFATFRDDTDECLGPVSKKYSRGLLQPSEIFEFVDPFVQAHESHHYESAIVLGRGERMAVQVRVPEADFKVLGIDEHRAFVTFATSFDRSWAHNPTYNTVRVVCANTARQAAREGLSMFGKVRHSSQAKGKLEHMRDVALGLIQDAKTTNEAYEDLAKRSVSGERLIEIMERLYPPSEKRSTRRDNIVADILELYESNDGNTFPEFRGTAYNLLNSIIEHVDHHSGVRKTQKRGNDELSLRAENAVFGDGAKFKETAFEVIYQSAQTMPYKGIYARAIERGAEMRAQMGEGPIESSSVLNDILDIS